MYVYYLVYARVICNNVGNASVGKTKSVSFNQKIAPEIWYEHSADISANANQMISATDHINHSETVKHLVNEIKKHLWSDELMNSHFHLAVLFIFIESVVGRSEAIIRPINNKQRQYSTMQSPTKQSTLNLKTHSASFSIIFCDKCTTKTLNLFQTMDRCQITTIQHIQMAKACKVNEEQFNVK